MIWFLNISDISIYITSVSHTLIYLWRPQYRHWLPQIDFPKGFRTVWLRWINMSTARFKFKTRSGCFIWMYLWGTDCLQKSFHVIFILSDKVAFISQCCFVYSRYPGNRWFCRSKSASCWQRMNLHFQKALLQQHVFLLLIFLFSVATLSTFNFLYPGWSTFVSIYKNAQPVL